MQIDALIVLDIFGGTSTFYKRGPSRMRGGIEALSYAIIAELAAIATNCRHDWGQSVREKDTSRVGDGRAYWDHACG